MRAVQTLAKLASLGILFMAAPVLAAGSGSSGGGVSAASGSGGSGGGGHGVSVAAGGGGHSGGSAGGHFGSPSTAHGGASLGAHGAAISTQSAHTALSSHRAAAHAVPAQAPADPDKKPHLPHPIFDPALPYRDTQRDYLPYIPESCIPSNASANVYWSDCDRPSKARSHT